VCNDVCVILILLLLINEEIINVINDNVYYVMCVCVII